MEYGARNHSQKAKMRRKELRQEASISEQVFWEAIRKDRLGYRFRRQVSVGRYFLDFYCAAAQLAIEIDGEQHLGSQVYDARRDAEVALAGIEIMRIPSLDLFDPNGVALSRWLTKIELRCAERAGEFEAIREARERG